MITIAGYNLKSQNFNVGSTSDTSAENEGDDFVIWFERAGEDALLCEMDRQFSIMARHVGDHDSIFCRTPKITRRGQYDVKMKVDGGETMAVGTFKFEGKYSPQLYHIFPAASAPARNKDETFEQMAYWTEWYSNDNDQDANEYESLGTIQRNNPKVFYRIVVNSKQAPNFKLGHYPTFLF